MINFIIVYMILCSMLFLPFLGTERVSQEVIYMFMGIFLATMYVIFPVKRYIPSGENVKHKQRLIFWYGIFVIYNAILFIMSRCLLGSNVLFNIFISFLVFNVVLSIDKGKTVWIFKTILWIAIANLVYMIIQQMGWDVLFALKGPHGTLLPIQQEGFMGFLCAKFAMSIFMGVSASAMLFFNPIISFLFFIPLFFGVTTGAILGTIVGILHYFWWMSRRLFMGMVLILVVGAGLYIWKVDSPMGYLDTRPKMWKEVLFDFFHFDQPEGLNEKFLGNPVFGNGIDAFRMGNMKYLMDKDKNTILAMNCNGQLRTKQNKPINVINEKWGIELQDENGKRYSWWDNPHNSAVEVLFNYGLLGILIICMAIYNFIMVFRYSIKTRELVVITSMLLVFMVSSMTQFPFDVARLGNIFPVLLGLFILNAE